MSATVSNGGNGRDSSGRFVTGAPPGPGNPRLKIASKLRCALNRAITQRHIRDAIGVIVDVMRNPNARDGDRLTAANLLLDRACGKPSPTELLERVEALESLLKEWNQNGRRHSTTDR